MFEVEGKAAASVCEIRLRIGVAALCMVFSLVWGIVSFYRFFGGDPATWFARSGAVITVLALLTETQLCQGAGKLNNAMSGKYLNIFKFWRGVALLAAIVGTLIWGYGDMFYCKVWECLSKN